MASKDFRSVGLRIPVHTDLVQLSLKMSHELKRRVIITELVGAMLQLADRYPADLRAQLTADDGDETHS